MVLAAAALLAAPPLTATTWRGDTLIDQLNAASWRLGPFRIQPRLVLSDFGYDSNIYHRPDAVPDYSLTGGPQITAYLSLKRKVIFSVSESPRYVYYIKTANERTWNNFLTANASFLLNRVFLQIGGHANSARQRWSYEIDVRPRLNDSGYEASGLWQITPKVSLSAAFRQNRYRYEADANDPYDIAGRLNRDETAVNLMVYRQMTARMRAFIDLEYSRAGFELESNPRSASSQTVFGGVEFNSTGRIRGRLRFGYKAFTPVMAGQPSYHGLVGDSTIAVNLMQPLVLRASYGRDVRFSVWTDNPFYVQDASGGGLSLYILKRRFRLDYDYSQLRYDYPSRPAAETDPGAEAAAPTEPRRDRIYMNTVGVFYRLAEGVGIGLRAGLYSRRVNIYNWKINRDFIGLNLTYEF